MGTQVYDDTTAIGGNPDADPGGEPEVLTVPRGRTTGLSGALACAVRDTGGALPLPDSTVGDLRSRRRMFDYDPALALELDFETHRCGDGI